MNISLKIFLIVSTLIYLGIIINLLRKKSLNLKYSLLWIFSGISMLIISIFPEVFLGFAKVVGIVDGTNLVFVVAGMFMLIILLSLTAIVSHMNEKNRRLIQVVSIMEKRLRDLENNSTMSKDKHNG